jgi:hypothetical protein
MEFQIIHAPDLNDFRAFDFHGAAGTAWAQTRIAEGAGRLAGDRQRSEAFGELRALRFLVCRSDAEAQE